MTRNAKLRTSLWTTLLLTGTAGLLVFSLGWLAPWATPLNKDRAAAVNATRQTLLAALAGLVATTGLVTGVSTYLLTRRGQATDRYAKAVALLASASSIERIGGLFALERLLHESQRDHETIVEVLTAFVRQSAPAPPGSEPVKGDRHAVQAALTIIGRRPRSAESADLNLARTDLRGMALVDANLRQADLRGCRMERVNLSLADCRNATLNGSTLGAATLIGTNFRSADLTRADLAGADLDGADLDGARLHGTRFCDESDQAPARSLTAPQLRRAVTDAHTVLPSQLRRGQGRDVSSS